MAAQTRAVVLILGMLALIAGIVISTVFLINGFLGEPIGATEEVREPITRAELMARYAEIAPLDESATPATMDGLADEVCGGLDEGSTTDQMIIAVTDMLGPDATEVVQLLVSYHCPEHLDLFR